MTSTSDRDAASPDRGDYRRWEVPAVDAAGTAPRGERERRAYAEAYARGEAAGHEAGRAAAQGELADLTGRLRDLLAALAAPLRDVDEQAERDLVALALAIARQVVRRELQADPGHVLGAVREALAALPAGAGGIRLHLHPDDAALVRDTLGSGGQTLPWEVVEDPVMTRGGCRVETAASRVDATVEGRLNAVVARVLGGDRAGDPPPGDAAGLRGE